MLLWGRVQIKRGLGYRKVGSSSLAVSEAKSVFLRALHAGSVFPAENDYRMTGIFSRGLTSMQAVRYPVFYRQEALRISKLSI